MTRLQTLTLVAAVGFVYWRALSGGFVWDDVDIYIVDNKLLREADGLWRFWLTAEPPDYYPLAYSTFWIEFRFFGLNPIGYHIDNLILHFLVSLMVWRVGGRLGVAHPWLASLLFAVHPVAVESAAWISQRKTLLATLFGLLSAAAFLRANESKSRGPMIASVVWYVVSLTAKPSLIGLPILFVLFDRQGRGKSVRESPIRIVPFLIPALVLAGVGWWFQQQRAIGGDLVREQSLVERLATGVVAAWFYLGKVLWPSEVFFIYPKWTVSLSDWRLWLAVAAWPVALAAALRFDRRRTFAALIAFLVLLAPVLGLVDVYFWRYSYVADHYQYAALAAAMMWLASWRFNASPLKAASIVVLVGVAVWWAIIARQAAAVYISEESVWRDVLRKNPSAWMAHANLIDLLLAQGKTEEAYEHEMEVRRLTEPETSRQIELAEQALVRGDRREEERRLRQALELNPFHQRANRRMAFLLAEHGRWAEAMLRAKQVKEPDAALVDLIGRCMEKVRTK